MSNAIKSIPRAWDAWKGLKSRIDSGELIILDGGTGTELLKRGVEMDDKGWSCAVQLFHPDAVRDVHADYIKAGSDVVTACTYASNRCVLASAGLGERTVEAINVACQLACEACDAAHKSKTAKDTSLSAFAEERSALSCPKYRPLVAGSLSTHPPAMQEGGSSSVGSTYPPAEEESSYYIEAAEALAASARLGHVDVLFLEMMKNLDHGPRAIAAAANCGLPVCLGISARLEAPKHATATTAEASATTDFWVAKENGGEGSLVFYGSGAPGTGEPFTVENVRALLDAVGEALVCVNVMHTNFSATSPALAVVRAAGWKGPVGAYPDHGCFRMPDWEFEEVDTAEARKTAEGWVRDYGVSLIGGCCGLGPDWIQQCAQLRDDLYAERSSGGAVLPAKR